MKMNHDMNHNKFKVQDILVCLGGMYNPIPGIEASGYTAGTPPARSM